MFHLLPLDVEIPSRVLTPNGLPRRSLPHYSFGLIQVGTIGDVDHDIVFVHQAGRTALGDSAAASDAGGGRANLCPDLERCRRDIRLKIAEVAVAVGGRASVSLGGAARGRGSALS